MIGRFDVRWTVFAFAVACAAFTIGIISTGFSFWIAPWRADFGVPVSVIMLIYTAANLMYVLVGPAFGRALDFFSVRVVIVAGALVMAAGLALAALAHQYWVLIASFGLLVAVGGSFVGTLPATVIGVRLFPERAGLVNGIVAFGCLGLSGVIIAAFATALIGPIGWRGVFFVAASIIAFIFAPLAWFVLDRSEGAPAKTLQTPAAAGDGAKGFDALKNPAFWALLAASLPIMVVLNSMMSSLAAIVADIDADPGHVAMMVSIFQIAAAAGSLIGGWLSDRIGLRTVYACILGGISIPLAILAFAPGLYVVGAALLLMGFAGGSVMPWSGAVVARFFGVAAFARVFGLLIAFFTPASFAPILVGLIRDATGAYHLAFLMLLVLLTPGALSLAFFLRPPAPERIAAAAGA